MEIDSFSPNEPITRAEFATLLVRALGLDHTGIGLPNAHLKYIDVDESHSALQGIAIADEWGVIKGYSDGTFKPNDNISREEAMTMYARAMDIVRLAEEDNNRIAIYEDAEAVSNWAYESVKKTLSVGVFNARTNHLIAPGDSFTNAEAVTSIRNLLIGSRLINDFL